MNAPFAWSFEIAVRTLDQEARGEPVAGQQAVAHVIVNRLKDGRWGTTLAAVCLAPYQFSGWNAHDPNRIRTLEMPDDDSGLVKLRPIMQAALGGEADPTSGAMWYYAALIPKPGWAVGAEFCGQFGSQLFYKGVP